MWPTKRGLKTEDILSKNKLILKKSNIVLVDFKGVTKPLTVWCMEFKLNSKLVRRRIKEFGWSVEDAFFYPNRQKRYNKEHKPIKYLNNKQQKEIDALKKKIK